MRILIALTFSLGAALAQRITLPLDGSWQLAESMEAESMPAVFDRTGAVPGLVNLARPPFPRVDEFDSRELIQNRIRRGELPASALPAAGVGVSRQPRNYFWYRRTFRAPARKQVAILKVAKAQFGTAVWLNGRKIGEHLACFSAGFFDLSAAIRWEGENDLVVRVGAHPGVLPEDIVAGTDFEKLKWTPGIYDSVSLVLANNPVIETVQVAPHIADGTVTAQIVLRNYGPARAVALSNAISPWKGAAVRLGATRPEQMGAGERKTITVTLKVPAPVNLWSPEQPFLYVLTTLSGGDRVETRFGMREFRFDTPTKRAYLNGKPYFPRGSNITFHRFLEDPEAGDLAWREDWVRRLLIEIPKRMHWNAFRLCIGPVPDRWLEIADEAGLLLQNEFFVWTGGETWPSWHAGYTAPSLIAQYSEWMRDNWNHPSVAVWDASNETAAEVIAREVIPEVRKLDLSNRPWENGYNLPSGLDDPVEDHPYLFSRNWNNDQPGFAMTELERMTGAKTANAAHPTAHPVILNEYGWLWLNRDGSPTRLTGKVYEKLLGRESTARQRLDLDAYLLAGLTEFWRAHRNAAGVLHFVYLTCSYPGVFTSDHFRDLKTLTLDPAFADWVGEAFKPVGVYVNFWQPKLARGERRRVAVMMVNDEQHEVSGDLELRFDQELISREPFSLPASGAHSYSLELRAPDVAGDRILSVTARGAGTTVSRRKVRIE